MKSKIGVISDLQNDLGPTKIFLRKCLHVWYALQFSMLNFSVSVVCTLKPETVSVRIMLCWFPIQPPEALAILSKFEKAHKQHEKIYSWQFYKVCRTWKIYFYYFLLRRGNVHSFEFSTTPALCKFYLQ